MTINLSCSFNLLITNRKCLTKHFFSQNKQKVFSFIQKASLVTKKTPFYVLSTSCFKIHTTLSTSVMNVLTYRGAGAELPIRQHARAWTSDKEKKNLFSIYLFFLIHKAEALKIQQVIDETFVCLSVCLFKPVCITLKAPFVRYPLL